MSRGGYGVIVGIKWSIFTVYGYTKYEGVRGFIMLKFNKISEKESGCELLIAEEKNGRIRMFWAIFALLGCGMSLYMQQLPIAVFCFVVYFVLGVNKLPLFLEKHGDKIFIAISALIVCLSIATRIVMYTKYRSLWLDEAMLAESIVTRNWTELLTPPLSNNQSAPLLYVIAVKAVCSVLGYSEFSLRIFSFFSFIGLLVCEWVFLKKIIKLDNIKTAFVLIMTAVVPSFVYFSNELKPYMSDAFFVVLALLLYAFYTQNKISLAKLTVSYALILVFCTPAIFFIGGILMVEFLVATFARDKKHILYVSISGLSVVMLFGLYYYWWMLPVQGAMDSFWNKSQDKSCFNAFFIVIVISLYFLYTLHSQKRLSLIVLTLLYMFMLMFCPPIIFFVGGILTRELFVAAFARNKKQVVSTFASLLSIATVFGLYYQARTSFVSETLNDFWNNTKGKTELITQVKSIFSPFSFPSLDSTLVFWVLLPLALLGIYSLIKQRNKVAYSVILSMFFACLASSIGKWPLIGRLWLFLPALVLIFSSIGYDLISKSNSIIFRKVIFCIFSVITVYYSMSCYNICKNSNGLYNVLEEVNPLIQYVKERIKKDEKLYVYPPARYALMFKNGYNNHRIGQTDKDNIIYGVNRDEWKSATRGAELDTIIKSRKAYILFQHHNYQINPGLEVLQNHGTLIEVLNYQQTPLLYFKARE